MRVSILWLLKYINYHIYSKIFKKIYRYSRVINYLLFRISKQLTTLVILLVLAVSINAGAIPLGLTTIQTAAGISNIYNARPGLIPVGNTLLSGSLAVSAPVTNLLAPSLAAIKLSPGSGAIQIEETRTAIPIEED